MTSGAPVTQFILAIHIIMIIRVLVLVLVIVIVIIIVIVMFFEGKRLAPPFSVIVFRAKVATDCAQMIFLVRCERIVSSLQLARGSATNG